MKLTHYTVFGICSLILCLNTPARDLYNAVPLHKEKFLAPVKTVLAEDKIYLAGAGNHQILEFDKKTGKILRRLQLSQSPIDMKMLNGQLYVTCASPSGEIYIIDPFSFLITRTLRAGHTPMAPVLSADKKKLYVGNRFNNEIAVFDLISGKIIKHIPVLREPVAALLSDDVLVVANHLSDRASNAAYTGCSISLIDTKNDTLIKHIALNDGITGVRDICLSSDGKYAYLSSVLGRHRVPTTQLERGWVNTNALTIIDLQKQKLFTTLLLDDLDQGAANPWAIQVNKNKIVITLAGTHELMVLDERALLQSIEKRAPQQLQSLANNLTFLNAFKQRIPLKVNGPRSLALDGDQAWVSGYFSDSLESLDLTHPNTHRVTTLDTQVESQKRHGEKLFNDASFCFQKWMSCASCHPDTRVDAFNWDLPNDGLGSPRNVKNMIFAHETPPTTVTGCRANAETSVRAGIAFFMAVLPETDAQAIDQYLKTMQQTPSPALVKGELSESAQLGKQIFNNEANCSECHSGPYFTDKKKHRVGTGLGREVKMKYDVPTLREVWRTAPYLHDGRAISLKDIFTKFNPNDKHGDTNGLSKRELHDLVEYVKSL